MLSGIESVIFVLPFIEITFEIAEPLLIAVGSVIEKDPLILLAEIRL